MSWCEIKAEIPCAAADLVETVLLELGVENWSLLEDAIARRAWVVGVFPGETEALARWKDLQLALPEVAASDAAVRPLADEDWRDSYKAHFHAWQFGRLHWVPVWEKESFRLPPGEVVLWLDPGLAFGTGNHETTRLCIERLSALEEAHRSSGRPHQALQVIDAGCGSGILALSAALLGFGRVAGFDNDPEAVRISRENALLNGMAERVDFFRGGLDAELEERCADVILANIQADVLMCAAAILTRSVSPAGILILSGILAVEIEAVRAAYAAVAPDWATESRVMGEWCDLQLVRPG